MRKFVYILFLVAGISCKEKYDLPYTGPATGSLVVEGTINCGQGPTIIRLSRTLALVDSVEARPENSAFVRVEGDDNSQFYLPQNGPGIYSNPQLTLQQQVNYRLAITTQGGKTYYSEYTPVRKTPPVDGIGWEREPDGVQFHINSHDPQNNTRYYKWEYEETWEFRSNYMSLLQYVYDPNTGRAIDVIDRPFNETLKMYYCWAKDRSTTILIGSSARLSRDTIHLPIHFVPVNSWKINDLYSLMVRQYAVSPQGYEFLQRMKKNTEQVGSLFDAQPSDLRGNITCMEDPEEIVIGYVEVSEAQERRIFIRNSEVLPWRYFVDCEEFSIPNHPDSIASAGLTPTSAHLYTPMGKIARFYGSVPVCVDCTIRGSNVKPSYWP